MTARAATVLLFGAFLLIPATDPGAPARSQLRHKPPDLLPAPVLPDTTASMGEYVREHIEEFATTEFHERLNTRRRFQRSGYLRILHDILALDPLSALLSVVRTRLQLEYSLPRNTIYFRTDTGALVPLPEDWAFPADPWSKE